MQQSRPSASPQADPTRQPLAAASQLLPDLDFLHVVTRRPSEVCLVARNRPTPRTPQPTTPFIVYIFRPVTDPDHLQHFHEAAAALMQLKHPSLGIPHHFGVTANHPYFLVEIPPGASLTQLQQAKQLRPADVVHVIAAVAAALETAHQHGIHHHSLTPDDIIVSPDGAPTILRLGFAGMIARRPTEQLAFLAHTPPRLRRYLAPEQNAKRTVPDPRSDIYTTAAILYELLTSRKIGGAFVLPSSVSKLETRVDDLISIALQRAPENRLPSFAEFGTYLTPDQPADPPVLQHGDPPTGKPPPTGNHETQTATATATATATVKRAVAITVSLLVIAAGCAALYFNAASDTAADSALIDRLTAMQELDGTTMTTPQRAETHAQISAILGGIAPEINPLPPAITAFQRLGDYPAAEKILAQYIAGLPGDTTNINGLKATLAGFKENIDSYTTAMEEAEIARSAGDDTAELAALEEAFSFLPDDCSAQHIRSQNPIHLEREVAAAIAETRGQIPAGEPLFSSYLVRRGAVDIDLSDNRSLTSLAAFASLPIEELDLSNTGVSDLTPLAGMGIRKLWLDDTRVIDLSTLLGMPLDTLTFENCAIGDPSVTTGFEQLATTRYTTSSGRREFTIPPPIAGEPWENDLGMRFVPLEVPGSNLLVSRWETRQMDFDEFASHAGSLLGDGGAGTSESAGQNTNLSKRSPVANVSLVDARAFCKWLTSHSEAAGFLPANARFRLPTDYEWSLAAGLGDHPMLSPNARALQGSPLVASTAPGILPVGKTSATATGIHGLWDNVREWTSTPADEGTAHDFSVRGLY
ncbi:MAG: SUMF1/EgtB/PvdO family nonheme iron enzyme, partial [Verrucomicrobiales bacterium]|nr:SUMF1/EgtB/PvdO family nonheme iron enzyme [Verrucomicrobiales bacterium]